MPTKFKLNTLKKAFIGEKARPAWLKKGGTITDIREIPGDTVGTIFLAYLNDGMIVNLEVLKDKDGKYLLDRIGGELVSTHKDEGQ